MKWRSVCQTSVPEVIDNSKEPDSIFELYGPDSRKPGTFCRQLSLARRLAEKGVKCIQLYHQGWDQHGNLPKGISTQCRETDQPAAALITDLKQRGLLDDTLVIWGGEFGRTNYSQGKTYQHRLRPGSSSTLFHSLDGRRRRESRTVFGETCEFGYNVVKNPVHVHDFHATMLRLLGIDHERLTFKYQGRRFRLTDVFGKVVEDVLA
jgi:hypothetical protein